MGIYYDLTINEGNMNEQINAIFVRWMIVGAFRDEPIIVIVKDR